MRTRRLLLGIALLAAMLGLGASQATTLTSQTWIVTYDAPPNTAQIQELTSLGTRVHAYQRLPMAAVVVSPDVVDILRNLPGVRGAYANYALINSPDYALIASSIYALISNPQYALINDPVAGLGNNTTGAGQVWADGYTGAGIGVAVIDAGVDGTHPDLCAAPQFCNGTPVKTVQNVKILGDQQDGIDPVVVLENQVSTDSTSGHGSHVSGIAAGWGVASQTPGKYRGVAWGANLIGIGTGEVLDVVNVLAGFDYVIAHKDQYNIKVVNNSWGPGAGAQYDPNDPVQRAIAAAHDAGITVVFGSGNDGPKTGPINAFSVNPKAISAAGGSKSGHIALFSSRGVPGSTLFRPTVTAPGQFIVSVRAKTGFYGDVADLTGPDPNDPILPPDDLYYAYASGTSMSSPHVAGIVALMQEAAIRNLGRYLTPDEVKNVLQNTAVSRDASRGPGGLPNYEDYSMGAGTVDALAAVHAVASGSGLQPYNGGISTDVRTFKGNIGPSAVATTSSFASTYNVLPGAISLDVMADWQYATLTAPADEALQDLDIDLYRPDGSLYLSTTAHLDTAEGPNQYSSLFTQQPNERVNVNFPAAGVWRAVVHGTVSVAETAYGSWSVVYPAGMPLPAPQAASNIAVTGPSTPTAAGQTATLTALVTDAVGNPVINAPVSWTSSGVGSVVTFEPFTDERGMALATAKSDAPGTQVATAYAGNAAGSASVSWVGLSPPPLLSLQWSTPGKASGGGWINNPGKRNFGFFAEYTAQASAPGGDLAYDDKMGTQVRATSISSIVITNGNRATIKGTASLNGNNGYNFQVDVVDNGEPGSSDTFHLLVAKPLNLLWKYETQGALGGGNIQVQRYTQ